MTEHDPRIDGWAETVAQQFHEAYERLAPDHGYTTRRDSAVPWEQVPAANRALMVAVVRDLMVRRVITIVVPSRCGAICRLSGNPSCEDRCGAAGVCILDAMLEAEKRAGRIL